MLESPDMPSQPGVENQLYLASNSPRRKELIAHTGLDYTHLPAQVDETPMAGEDGVEYVQRIARQKALAASAHSGGDGVIIAADTAVVNHFHESSAEILGKPADQEDALRMLRSLRGHTHQVFTAIALLRAGSSQPLMDVCATDVPMRDYSEEEIREYIASGDPMDKAGAYAIQHAAFHPVINLQGCYANVMGLPICHLVRSLFKLGITPTKNVPQACQASLGYDCPVYDLILQDKIPDLALR